MNSQPLDAIPLWAVYPLTVITLLTALGAGFWLVKHKQRDVSTSDAGVGTISGAVLALFAFLGAFVVGFAVNVAQERRVLVVSEANAISTTYLRAGYLDEPFRTDSRSLLSEYADQRVMVAFDPQHLNEAKTRSEEIQQELWRVVERIIASGDKTPTTGLFISSLNEVIDLHTERVVMGLQIRVPPLVLWTMFGIAVFAMFLVGMHMGYEEKRSVIALVMLVLVIATVLYLIVDVDRAQEGLLQTPQWVMIDLQAQLEALP